MAARYEVDATRSELAFAGEWSGKPFRGVFATWRANIEFDAAHLADSHINVAIVTSTAKTGNAMIDDHFAEADWFDSGHFPEATFTSSAIHKNADGSYKALGTLKIRELMQPMSFDFTLMPPDAAAQEVQAVAKFAVKRLDFDMGKSTDPEAKWVGNDIALEVKLVAQKATPKP